MVKINQVYHKDNLELLRDIPDDHIDLIYCDILYGTGRDFIDYKDLNPTYKEINDHYHPRLTEMKRVLKPTGNVYLQMDWRINHWIRLIMDDIFGYNNFRNEIIWWYNSAPRKSGQFGNRHDTILRYSKTNDFIFNPIREPYSLTAPRGYAKEKYYHPEGKVIGDVWQMNIISQNDKSERVGYATQKPIELIDRIILSGSNPNDIVADFYMGSGTSMVSAKKLNRQWIGCDINEDAVRITLNRLNEINPLF